MLVLSNRNQWTVAIFFLLLFSFLVLRAWHVPLLPDEAVTYFLYAEPTIFFAPDAQEDANNHLLNSVLSSGALRVFGQSTFSLRIPSLLFSVLYMFASYQLARRQETSIHFWLTLVVLNTMYPIVEFHSLSRGYGMSFALLLYALHLLMCLQSEQKIGLAWLILGISILGLFAQLSLLFAFGGVLFLASMIWLRQSSFRLWQKLIFPTLSLVVLLLFVSYIHHLKTAGLLYFGTVEGFPISSLISLNMLLFDQKSFYAAWLHLLVFCVPLVVVLYAIVKFKAPVFFKPSFVFPFVLFCSVVGTVISVLVMGGSGPLARTGLYFSLLLFGSLLLLDFRTQVKQGLGFLLMSFSSLSFSFANISQVNYWAYHAVQSAIYDEISKNSNPFKIVGGSDYLERIFAAEHNRFRKSFPVNYHVMRSDFASVDYLLLTPDDRQRFKKYLIRYEALVYSEEGVSLFKKKQTSSTHLLSTRSYTFEKDNHEYLGLGSLIKEVDFSKQDLILKVNLSLQLPRGIENISWVVSFFTENTTPIASRYYRLNEFSKDWKTGTPFEFALSIPQIPEDCHEVRLYIYNPQRQVYNKAKIEFSIYSFNNR